MGGNERKLIHEAFETNYIAPLGPGCDWVGAVKSIRVKRKREIFDYYFEALSNVPGVEFMPEAPYGRSNRWLTDKVVNTAEEAVEIVNLLQKREVVHTPPRVLLVTSAYHMRRSLLLFKRAGLEVTPFRVDFQVSEGRKMTILDFMPQGGSLYQTEKALREVYGYLYFLMRR